MRLFLLPEGNWCIRLADAIETGNDNDMIIVHNYDQLDLAQRACQRMRVTNHANDLRFAEYNCFINILAKDMGISNIVLIPNEWIEV